MLMSVRPYVRPVVRPSRTVAGHWEGLETWKSGFRTTNKVSRDVFFQIFEFNIFGAKNGKKNFCSICRPFQFGSWPNLSWGTTMGLWQPALSMIAVDWTQRSRWLILGLKQPILAISDLDLTLKAKATVTTCTWYGGRERESERERERERERRGIEV